MSFIDDVKNCFSFDSLPTPPTFRAVLFGDRALYLESVIDLVSYDLQEIVLRVKNSVVKVQGKGLYIKKFCDGDVVICGKISAIING